MALHIQGAVFWSNRITIRERKKKKGVDAMFDESMRRREFIKKTAYAVPVILTLKAVPAFAAAGSGRVKGNNGVGNGIDPQPPGNPPINDGLGTGPGNPGNRRRNG